MDSNPGYKEAACESPQIKSIGLLGFSLTDLHFSKSAKVCESSKKQANLRQVK